MFQTDGLYSPFNEVPSAANQYPGADARASLFGTIRVQGPEFPDATARLRMKLNKKHTDDIMRKKQMAERVEEHRRDVLDSFKISS